MAGWRDKAEKGGGMRDCKTLFWTLLHRQNEQNSVLVRTQEHALDDCPFTGLASSSNMSEKALSRRTAFTRFC